MPISWFLLTGLLLATAALTGCQPIRPVTTPGVTVTLTNPTDQATVAEENGAPVVHITSTTGIGSAELNLVPENPTQTVTLRFHLAGLEELQLRGGKTTFTVSVASTPPHAVHETMQLDAESAPVQLAPEHTEWTPVQLISQPAAGEAAIPIQDGYIDVVLPPAVADAGDGRVQLRWIDFYR